MSALFIGLMSGTSIDGIDAAVVDFDGTPGIVATHTHPIAPELKQRILTLSHGCDNELEQMMLLDREVGLLFSEATNQLLQQANIDATSIIAIGSHGQTVRHYPDKGTTLQIGDANLIAEKTGITTIADFRRRDLAAGGEGAPLAPAFHNAVFRSTDEERVIINLGGIANITHLPVDSTEIVSGFDTGPANILMDSWTERHLNQPFDRGGDWAKQGEVNQALLEQLLQEPYLSKAPPKSTGRELFNSDWLTQQLNSFGETIAPEAVQATLCQFTATTIADAITNHCGNNSAVFVCGGGAHNRHLMQLLQTALPNLRIDTTEALGVSPDWVEATAFAWLAKQTLEGKAGNLPAVTGASHPVVLGAIYS